MRLTLLTITILLLLPTAPALALSGDEQKLLDNINTFEKSLRDQSSGAKGKAGTKQVQEFERCIRETSTSRAVRKKLKIKKNRNFILAISLGLWVNEILIASHRVYKEDYLQEANSLESLAVSDATILAASRAGAARIRNTSTFYTKPRNPVPGCFIFRTLVWQPKWNLKSYAAAYLKGMGWTASGSAALGREDAKLEPTLKAGYKQLKSNGASKEELEKYQDLFTLDGVTTIRFNYAKRLLQQGSLGLTR